MGRVTRPVRCWRQARRPGGLIIHVPPATATGDRSRRAHFMAVSHHGNVLWLSAAVDQPRPKLALRRAFDYTPAYSAKSSTKTALGASTV